MLIYALGSWAITFFNLTLWTLTLAKRQLNPLAKAYFWWSFYITLWSFGYGITLSGLFGYDTTLTWNRWCQAMAIMIAPHFFRFGCVVADEFERYEKWYKIYLAFAIVNAFGLFFTPYYVKDLWSFGVFRYQPLGGPLYIIFAAFFWWTTFHSFLVAAQKYNRTTGTKRAQVRLFLLATGIAYSGGGELFFQGFRIPIPSYGVFPILAYVIIIGYAVHRYRFLNVSLVLKKTVVFTGLLGVLFSFVSLAMYLLQDLLGRGTGLNQAVGVALTIGAVILFFHPLERLMIHLTDKFLFQRRYDYRQLLREFTDEALTILDMSKLVDTTVHILLETIKLEHCALLLLNRTTNRYDLTASAGISGKPPVLENKHPLIKLLQQAQEPLARDLLPEWKGEVVVVDETFVQLNAEVCLPLMLRGELVGILALGPKKSDEPYSKDELEVLMALANTLAIAISNALLAAEAAQQEKLAVIGTLTAAINHEVCNPLSNVKLRADEFLVGSERGWFKDTSKDEMEKKMTEFMQYAVQEIDRTAAITTRLSNFAKPSGVSTKEAIEVKKVVDEVLAILGHDFHLRSIGLEEKIPVDIPPILVDRRQLHEVLFNLVRNAGQAIGRDGKVTVQARLNGTDRVAIDVVDTGPGIPPEQLSRLFTPFFTTKKEGQGTGLGLFVVKRLVEQNDGIISVKSQPGAGATFTVEFPVSHS